MSRASGEEVARPRRSTPTPELISKKPPDDTMALAPLFGPPLESAFDEQKTEVLLDQPEIWGPGQPINPSTESPKLTRPFPTGTPPPLPPKNVPATPPRTGSPLTTGPGKLYFFYSEMMWQSAVDPDLNMPLMCWKL